MAYTDVAGRINTKSMTPDEWETLEFIAQFPRWHVPVPKEWKGMRDLLALVDIRRGFDFLPDGGIQLGVCQIRINKHGIEALRQHKQGKNYIYGERLTQQEIEDLVESED